jgi:hypothetical protein
VSAAERSPGRRPDPPLPPTAFPATARYLRRGCATATFDAAAFARPLVPCRFSPGAEPRCGGTCCAQGVTLNGEEALVIGQLARRHAARLRTLVPDCPDPAIVEDDDGVARTALKPRAMHATVPGYPAHFADTACAFLTADARCALQLLAVAEGEHPWAWKPLACWLHPVSVSGERITLPDRATDPWPEGFASVTPCGRTAPDGRPAREVLGPELAHLALWLGRAPDDR